MTRLVHLARHASHAEVGRVLSGRSDIALSAAGRAEAAALAERLRHVPLRAIHASPRRRALETARIVAEATGRSVEIADALDEIDFGEWTGQPFDALAGDPRWQAWNSRRADGVAPGGETMTGAVLRARRFIDGLPGDVLCVSHCDIIRGIVADVLGLSLERVLAFDCDPASLTTIARWNGGARVVSLNQRPVADLSQTSSSSSSPPRARTPSAC